MMTAMDDRPPEPSYVVGKKCRGCGTHRLPVRWYRVQGGTRRGDALGLAPNQCIQICPRCEERLQEWLDAGGNR